MIKSKIEETMIKSKIEKTSDASWCVSLEEDPETGEILMPLPDELLASQGWELGDELTWEFDETNRTATITKKAP